MSLTRHPQWQRKLANLITSARELQFQWGQFDCAMWVCAVVRDITLQAVDPGVSYRGTYSTEAQAIAIFGSSLGAFAATVATAAGMPEVAPTYARRGDVVWVDNGTSYGALGIVNLDGRFAMCVSQTGVLPVHMTKWKRAWRVG